MNQKQNKQDILFIYSSKYVFPTQLILNSLYKLDLDNLDFIDVSEDDYMIKKHNIKELPTMIVLSDGVEEKRASGSELIKNIDQYI